ncbi:MAG: hypothetical protein QOH11_246 [Solirubrobacteraceae bacterium]|jgi:hypothetical protein|nr:hypothetical protein [Solirubrobacteraceae bacterium]
MATWSTATTVHGTPESVLTVLTDPEACSRWSPVGFDLDELEEPRLTTGSRARVGGRFIGRDVGFDVEIVRADERALELRAHGPIDIEARYDARAHGPATRIEASVSVRGGGLTGRVLARAADGLLAAGALDRALTRIAGEVAV